ncbi:hypothetical protein WN71_006435 [Streptomyces mangrovisoli]|uniref:Secreted protein n=2 Tax=Streptomyces mangrovisoli TaxID=1428628 RepID=A0A1J4P5B2_9ACTN|nr:hypothetical protein WN71_006435 [Streptomyces mangrovisoli]
MQLAAASGLLSMGLFLVAVVLIALLAAGAWMTSRERDTQVRPTPEEQPKPPPGGPVRELRESREPDEVPHDGGSLTPYQLTNMQTKPGTSTDRPRWSKGSSGSFGGGGLGAH